MVYTSTVGCIGVPGDGRFGDEESPVSIEEMTGAYKRSKFLAEHVALEFAESGFPVVIVNPTAPIGDHDFRPTPTGRIVVDFLKGDMPAYIDTGLNVVSASDTAEGHCWRVTGEKPGSDIFSARENLTLEQIFRKLEAISGRKAPTMQVPYAVAYAAGVVTTGWAYCYRRRAKGSAGRGEDVTEEDVGQSCKGGPRTGFQRRSRPTPHCAQAVEWFRANGYV